MSQFSKTSIFAAKLTALGLVATAVLVACGGSSNLDQPPVKVSATNIVAGKDNTTVAAKTQNAAVLTAVVTATTPVTFASGFSGTNAAGAKVAVTEPTKVVFTANAADATAPKFVVESASGRAEGITTLGSCTFTVTVSTYPPGHPYSVGQSVKIDPCTVSLPTAGQKADGTVVNTTATFTFGTSTSTLTVPVAVSPNGAVTVNNVIPGVTTTVTNTSGG